MRVFVTGATGFVGRYVVRALRDAGHEVRCLVRSPTDPLLGADQVHGDILDPLAARMAGCDGVIHLVGIIRENVRHRITFERLHAQATAHVVREAAAAGVSRLIYVSANGVSAEGKTAYQTTKWAAEESVRNGGLKHWCILRPGLIFGDPGLARDEFCSILARQLIRPAPVIPIFGSGQYAVQPIHVGQVAESAVQALRSKAASRQTLVAVGPEKLTYLQLVDRITRSMGLRPKPKFHVPLWLIQPILRCSGNILPITADQLTMLLEGNCGDSARFFATFALEEHGFAEENLSYVRTRA
ncbi:MAG: NAD-dependent epimerase/dehydratase family protein [Bacteroidota bacterium]|nr:NAD-dependent epimerase/dehydratase family protein [Bacteroidota bacterium]